jgi:hypothetical protein
VRLARTVALAAVAAAALAACGGGDNSQLTMGSGDAVQRLRTAGETTSARGALTFDLGAEISVDGTDIGLTLSGVGDPSGAGVFEMSLAAPGLDGGPVHVVTDGATAWVSDDEQTWVAVDVAALGQAGASTDSATEMLELLESVGEVSVVGEEDIDGVPATHYRAEVDFAALAEMQGTAVDQEALEQLDLDSVPMEVWVDGEDIVRQLTLEFEADVEGSTMSMAMDIEMEPSAEPVTVDGPPAGEIVEGSPEDLAALFGA